jgi:molybdopterin biosynthesis enzyme
VSSSWKDGIWHATPVDHHSSGDLRSIALADSLLVIPENSGGVEKGSHLDLVRLTDL